MSKTGEIPYTWEQIADDVREAILCQAGILGAFGPGTSIAIAYLGLEGEEWDCHDMDGEQIQAVDITRHELYKLVHYAYLYAYQLDGCEKTGSDIWHAVGGLLDSFPQADHEGERSPFCTLNDLPLRRMLETFFARFMLFGEDAIRFDNLSIRELSLLANMTIPAVRTSLSKEGFKLKKSERKIRDGQTEVGFRLESDAALDWLSRRRGFIPQRVNVEESAAARIAKLMASDASFPEVLRQLVDANGTTVETLAQTAAIDVAWLEELAAGDHVPIDIDAIRRVARALEAPEPEFAARAIKHLVKLDSAAS